MADLSRILPSKELLRNYGPPAVLFLLALVLFSINNDFRLGLHFDEGFKVNAVGQGQYNYFHPLLMLEMTNLGTWLSGAKDPQAIVEVGRTLSAVIGAIGVAALFLLLRRRLSEFTAIVVCLAAAATPLLAVHAHYLKEDIWLFGFCALTALAYRRLNDQPRQRWNIFLLAASLACAIAGKAVGLFLIPVLILSALLQPGGTRRQLLSSVGLAIAGAVPLVVLINARMLFDSEHAYAGLSREFSHAIHGNPVILPWGYHLTVSLWQGIGPVWLGLAVVGLAQTLLRWRRAEPIDRFMALYGLIYYGLIEASPLNSGVRYAVPLVLPVAYLGGLAIEAIAGWLATRIIAWPIEKTAAGIKVALALALVPTAVTGVRLVAELKADTRLVAESLLAGKESQVLTELYGTSFGAHVDTLARVTPQRLPAEVRYLVASSLMYDRYADAAQGIGPGAAHAERFWSRYQALFRLPFCEIRPRVMSFAFSNPTIRIIDVQAARAVGWASATGGTFVGPACADDLNSRK